MGGFTCHGSVLALVPSVDLNPLIRNIRNIFSSFDGGMIGISRLPLINGFSARRPRHRQVGFVLDFSAQYPLKAKGRRTT